MDNFDIPLEPQDPKPGARVQFSGGYMGGRDGDQSTTTPYYLLRPWETPLYFEYAAFYNLSWEGLQDALGPHPDGISFKDGTVTIDTTTNEVVSTSGVITGTDPQMSRGPIGVGDYPDAMGVAAIWDAAAHSVDSFAIDRNTTIRFYKEKNFQGGIAAEFTGPALFNHSAHVNPDGFEESHTTADGESLRELFPEGSQYMGYDDPRFYYGDYPIPTISADQKWPHLFTQGSFKIRDSSVMDIPTPEPDASQECSTKLTVSFNDIDHWAYKIADRSEVTVGSGSTANVAGLSPGTYNVLVRGLDSEGSELARDAIIVNVPDTYAKLIDDPIADDGPWPDERPIDVDTGHVMDFNDFHARQRRVGNQEVWDWTQPGPPPPTPTPAPTSTPIPTATPMPTPTPEPVTGIDLEFYSGKYPYALHDVSYQHVIFWATVNITAPKNNLVKKDVEMVLAFGGRENSTSYWNIDTTGIEHQLDKTGDGIHPAVWIGFTNVGNSKSWFPAALTSQVSSPGGYNSWTMWGSGSHSQGFRPTGTGTFAWGLHRRTANGIDNTIGLRLGIHSQNGSLGGSTYSNGTDRFSWSEFLGDDFIMHEIKDFSWPNSARGFGWAFNCGPDTPTTQPYLKVEGVSVGNAGGQGSVPIHSTVSGL